MAIASTLQKYLSDRGVTYDVVVHEPTGSSTGTAEALTSPGTTAKGILLRDRQGYWLAVLPASRHVRMSDLKTDLGERIDLASEEEIAEVFRDCARGAVPPVGACYGLDVIIDTSIDRQPDLYFEAGDHATLIHLSEAEFARLNEQARHGSFSGD